MPAHRGCQNVEVLLHDGTFAFLRIIRTPTEDVVSSRFDGGFRSRNRGIRRPVDDGDDTVRGCCGNGGIIPVVLHLNFKLRAV